MTVVTNERVATRRINWTKVNAIALDTCAYVFTMGVMFAAYCIFG